MFSPNLSTFIMFGSGDDVTGCTSPTNGGREAKVKVAGEEVVSRECMASRGTQLGYGDKE